MLDLCCDTLALHIANADDPIRIDGDGIAIRYCKNGVDRNISLRFCPFCGVELYPPETPLTDDELAPAEAILKGVQSLNDLHKALGVPDRQFDRKPPWTSQLDYYDRIAGTDICVLVSESGKLTFLISRR